MRAMLVILALLVTDLAAAAPYVEAGVGHHGFVDFEALDGGRQQHLGVGASLRTDSRVMRIGGVLAWSHHHGMHWQLFDPFLSEAGLAQGDSLLLSLGGRFDLAFLAHPRVGVGVRADLGVGTAPLLMPRDAYNQTVVTAEWGGVAAPLHSSIHPVVGVGPQLTWYTPAGIGVGLHAGATWRSWVDLGYLVAVSLSWEPGE